MKRILALFALCSCFLGIVNDANAHENRNSTNHCFEKAVVGTYISDIFQRPGAGSGEPEDRSLLITIHGDGTISSYNSQAYSEPNGKSAFNGIQLTPSLGAWTPHGCHSIRAVFFDFFAFPLNDVVGENPNNFQVETTWSEGEYDRFAATIHFGDLVCGKYQTGTINLTLTGICHTCDPLNPNAIPTAEYTVEQVGLRRVNVLPGYFK